MHVKKRLNLKEIGTLFLYGSLLFCLVYALLGDKILTTFLIK